MEAEMPATPFSTAAALIAACIVFVAHAPTSNAQQAPTTPVRTVLGLTNLPNVIEAPLFFKLSKVELPAGKSTNYLGPVGFIYLLSGSLTAQVDATERPLRPDDALLVVAGKIHSLTAAEAEPAVFLHYVLARSAELAQAEEQRPAVVTELSRTAEPIPNLKPGPYEFTLTRVTFPPRMPPNVPHYRSGAALYYVLAGRGMFIADGKTESRETGMPHFEPHGWVHQWGNAGEPPLVLLQANISEEGVSAVILVE
jgi:quercetin dioxygenase-like cupin family protein